MYHSDELKCVIFEPVTTHLFSRSDDSALETAHHIKLQWVWFHKTWVPSWMSKARKDFSPFPSVCKLKVELFTYYSWVIGWRVGIPDVKSVCTYVCSHRAAGAQHTIQSKHHLRTAMGVWRSFGLRHEFISFYEAVSHATQHTRWSHI